MYIYIYIYIYIHMTLFEQNCNNLKMAAIGRNTYIYMYIYIYIYIWHSLSKIVITWRLPQLAETCSYFLLLNTIINPHYHSCVFMTDIYLTIRRSLVGRKSSGWTQNVCCHIAEICSCAFTSSSSYYYYCHLYARYLPLYTAIKTTFLVYILLQLFCSYSLQYM